MYWLECPVSLPNMFSDINRRLLLLYFRRHHLSSGKCIFILGITRLLFSAVWKHRAIKYEPALQESWFRSSSQAFSLKSILSVFTIRHPTIKITNHTSWLPILFLILSPLFPLSALWSFFSQIYHTLRWSIVNTKAYQVATFEFWKDRIAKRQF